MLSAVLESAGNIAWASASLGFNPSGWISEVVGSYARQYSEEPCSSQAVANLLWSALDYGQASSKSPTYFCDGDQAFPMFSNLDEKTDVQYSSLKTCLAAGMLPLVCRRMKGRPFCCRALRPELQNGSGPFPTAVSASGLAKAFEAGFGDQAILLPMPIVKDS